MKNFFVISILAVLAFNAAAASGDVKQAVDRAAVIVGRAAVGTAVGGTAGAIIGGGAIGTGVGVILSPSKIGCGPNELCKQTTR